MSQLKPQDASLHTPDIGAERIFEALCNCYSDCREDSATLIENALCDLRHLCDRDDLAYASLDRLGHRLYCEEREAAS